MLTNDPAERTTPDVTASASPACEYCDTVTSRLYSLPDSVIRPHQTTQIACYFCFVRLVGLRPKRRQLVPPSA